MNNHASPNKKPWLIRVKIWCRIWENHFRKYPYIYIYAIHIKGLFKLLEKIGTLTNFWESVQYFWTLANILGDCLIFWGFGQKIGTLTNILGVWPFLLDCPIFWGFSQNIWTLANFGDFLIKALDKIPDPLFYLSRLLLEIFRHLLLSRPWSRFQIHYFACHGHRWRFSDTFQKEYLGPDYRSLISIAKDVCRWEDETLDKIQDPWLCLPRLYLEIS